MTQVFELHDCFPAASETRFCQPSHEYSIWRMCSQDVLSQNVRALIGKPKDREMFAAGEAPPRFHAKHCSAEKVLTLAWAKRDKLSTTNATDYLWPC